MILRMHDLHTTAHLGVYDWEQKVHRKIVINLEVEYDGATAAGSDRLEDALDYDALERRVIEAAQARRFALVEALVAAVGAAVLAFPPVRAVTVEVAKPGALMHTKHLSVRERYAR